MINPLNTRAKWSLLYQISVILTCISQNIEPIPDMFVLWMHYDSKYGHEIPQIWHFFTKFVTFFTCRLHSPAAWKPLRYKPLKEIIDLKEDWLDRGRCVLFKRKPWPNEADLFIFNQYTPSWVSLCFFHILSRVAQTGEGVPSLGLQMGPAISKVDSCALFKGTWPDCGPDLLHCFPFSIWKGIIRTV